MAYNITIPFQAFRLQLTSGIALLMPMADMKSIQIEETFEQLAEEYREAFQKDLLNAGSVNELLRMQQMGNYQKSSLIIDFPKAKNGYSYPDFQLSFDYYFTSSESGYHAIVPVLAVEAYAAKKEDLVSNLKEVIRLEFKWSKRLHNVQDILSVIWYENTALLNSQIDLRTLTPEEVINQNFGKEKPLLPLVAKQCEAKDDHFYGRAELLERLMQALQNSFNRNVLLVGASGVGKTALIREASRCLKLERFDVEIWETTASKMLKELMRETSWQDNLAKLCGALRQENRMLFIRNLMELFEVGQYEGNDLSIADYLRSYLSRGEVAMISECTPDELAAIELRSPNYIDAFHVIRLGNPKKELEEIVIKKASDLSEGKNITIEQEAIQEVIRLNLRYTPYSGLPGKPIRFIENLLIESSTHRQLSKSEVIAHFCEETGMPAFMVDPMIPMNVHNIRQQFNQNVFGQTEAVDKVVNVLASVKTALTRKEKPIASFLFVGPTGVGKTELAKVLAEFMFQDREKMLRFDMSEYSDPWSVNRLIGGDFGSDGTLTSAVRRAPFCVLLFDEIEKAHFKFYDLLLQILGEGRLSDGRGKLVNFCSTLIIMTSNIGADRRATIRLGDEAPQSIADHYLRAVQQHFRPELFGRIDEVIPFLPLSREIVRHVVEREMAQFRKREGIHYRSLQLKTAPEVLDYLAHIGYDDKYGARHLQRTLRKELILPLAQQLNQEDGDDRLEVNIKMLDEHTLSIEVEVDPKGTEAYMEELEKMLTADHASKLRRRIDLLKDGLLYIELEDELARLAHQKEQQQEGFWKNSENSQKYLSYQSCQSTIQQLTQQIEQLENSLSLAYMNLQPYQEELEQQLKDWEEAFFGAKVQLFAAMNPDSSSCQFAVYGTHLQPVVDFYQQLLAAKEFEYELESIHFNETYYVEKQHLEQTEEEPQEYYLRAIVQNNDFSTVKQQQLFGIIFHIKKQDAVYMYLEQEEGMQEWRYSEKDQHRYRIAVHRSATLTPKSIHRKDFYKRKSIARLCDVHQHFVQDNALNLKREYQKGQLVELVREKLDEVFKEKLDRFLL